MELSPVKASLVGICVVTMGVVYVVIASLDVRGNVMPGHLGKQLKSAPGFIHSCVSKSNTCFQDMVVGPCFLHSQSNNEPMNRSAYPGSKNVLRNCCRQFQDKDLKYSFSFKADQLNS